jgi:hypothetical protein
MHDQIADLLLSGRAGMPLVAALRQQFPHATRGDVFFAVAMVVSVFESERLGLVYDIERAEARIAELEAALAASLMGVAA